MPGSGDCRTSITGPVWDSEILSGEESGATEEKAIAWLSLLTFGQERANTFGRSGLAGQRAFPDARE